MVPALDETHRASQGVAMFDFPLNVSAVGLIGSPLDRADTLRRDPQAVADARAAPGARWLLFQELNPLVVDGSVARVPRDALPDLGESVFLGLENGEPRFAAVANGAALNGEFQGLRQVAAAVIAAEGATLSLARSLLEWHTRNSFCSNCGAKSEMAKGGYARHCPACGTDHFPRVDPVAIMLAVDTERQRVLLGRQRRFPPRFVSALAGFVEPGEGFEEAVRRELHEEAGIRTDRVAYVASQPWPFPHSLMIGAFAEATSTEITIDENELEAADWYSREQVTQALEGTGQIRVPPPLAIAHTLLRTWVDYIR
ncbi:MAG: NAD(+) diphosphatase [Myxococcota bacterium]